MPLKRAGFNSTVLARSGASRKQSKMAGPTSEFWQQRFETGQTAWDRGRPSPGLLRLLDSADLKPCRIAVPGCGSGWEVVELARRGFEVIGIDYTDAAIERSRAHCAAAGVGAELVRADVLDYDPVHRVDAVFEQTCLCAIHPEHWFAYADRLRAWLLPGGSLHAMFMQMLRPAAIEEGQIQGPPYHCDINAMRALFPSSHWAWPKPPYARVDHPMGAHELAVTLVAHG